MLVYCRESRDEGGLQSERIETQKAMLLRYAEEENLGRVVRIISDDDMTGTDFTRLNVVRELAARREIDVLLCKDSSRLGRNLTESLLFTEFLSRTGVELIFQSEAYNEDIFPLEAWFHEMRAKEDSRKIRGVLYHKMETGEFLIAPPYGYKREGTRLFPDPETADAVREIFDAFLAGAATGEIAARLDAEGRLPPSLYKGRSAASDHWSAGSVRHILENESYTGVRVMKKTVGRSFKDKKRIVMPPEARVTIRDDHEPLITREAFEAAEKLLAAKRRGSGRKTPYGGLLYCGGCGGKLILRDKKGRPTVYVCAAYNRYGTAVCTAHRVTPEELAALTRGAAYGAYLLSEGREQKKKNGPTLEELYEDLAEGRISRAFFEKMRARISPDEEEMTPFDPAGHEEALAPLLLSRIVAYEKGEKGYLYPTLEAETRF